MKAALILAGPYSTCHITQAIWEKLCADKDIELTVFDLTKADGAKIADKLNIKSFPALIIDNKVIAVGHPNEKTAKNVFLKQLSSVKPKVQPNQ